MLSAGTAPSGRCSSALPRSAAGAASRFRDLAVEYLEWLEHVKEAVA